MYLFDIFVVNITYMKHIGKVIKKIREEKGLTQLQIAELIHMHRSNYSKVESGERDLSIESINKIAKYFGMSIDELVNFNGNIPNEVTTEDKTLMEQVKLIQELEPEEKNMVFKMIDTFLTKKKFKDFFHKNVATL
jgi:transcriptional regulator with XRE-family HTH domain